MGQILGIIGGGQLGMMLTEAAKKMPDKISKVIVLDPTEGCPANQVGAEQIVADFKDPKAIHELAEKSDIITYEIESGNSDVLQSVQSIVEVSPSPETLRIIQDKFFQKRFLSENKLPVAEFVQINSYGDLEQGLKKFGYPALLKARRDAYDGKGNFKINSFKDIQKAFNYFKGQNLMLEKFVQFKMEVSVIAVRNTKGQIKTFPLVENIHENNILRETIAPARVSRETSNKSEEIAKRTITVLKGAGVFGIEMFVTVDDDILINEIAPRVHNSGHHTLQSSETSQFDQHLRAILGLELGGVKLLHTAVMYNILGSKDFEGEYAPINISEKNVFLKMYGKKFSKPLRKLGHLNLIGGPGECTGLLLKKLESLKEKVQVISLTKVELG
jgi:5-(carboxyamino)imidazole ribonucleotide synthase